MALQALKPEDSVLKARREARLRVQSRADKELQGSLDAAKKALAQAQAVCTSLEREAGREDPSLASQARKNRDMLANLQNQLNRVQAFKSSLQTDVDLLPESSRAELAREKSLRQRVDHAAQSRARDTEQAVENLLSSLARTTR